MDRVIEAARVDDARAQEMLDSMRAKLQEMIEKHNGDLSHEEVLTVSAEYDELLNLYIES